MISFFEHETVLTYSVMPPLFIPFYNVWGQNVYTTYSPFDLDPFTIQASSTSGSPVLIAGMPSSAFSTPRAAALPTTARER